MSSNDVLSSRSYLTLAKEAALRLGKVQAVVTIEDVRQEIGDPPAHVSPTLMGQVFRGGKWTKVGEVPAARDQRRSARVSTFTLHE